MNTSHVECIQYFTTCDIPASNYCINCKCFDCVQKKNYSIDYEKRKQDGTWMAGKRAYSKAYYIQHNKRMKTQARIAYKINRKNKLATANALSKLVHAVNPELIKVKCRTWYNKNKASNTPFTHDNCAIYVASNKIELSGYSRLACIYTGTSWLD